MKLSKMHLNTLKEVPSGAEIPSHILLLRSGMIRQLASGIYGFMPMGWRSVRKIEDIVRKEMDARGGQEIHMSALQPAELWIESGRWSAMGPEMWRVKDRHNRDFCLGPTHEEIFTDIVRQEVDSYRQLPMNLYQIQMKYRDEARPRFGLMRSREFIMKDAYSFDRDFEGLDKSYISMYEAYENIFEKCGLEFKAVEADTGAMGGSDSHEFTAISDVGESEIVYCTSCDFSATTERADLVEASPEDDEMLEMESVHTPETKTIESLANFLGVDKEKTIKALLLAVDNEEGESSLVAAFIRGDRELNWVKLVNALGVPDHMVAFIDEAKIPASTNVVPGFTGPVGLKDIKIIVDSELPGLKNMVAGACRKDHHLINVNYGRDYTGDLIVDIKKIQEGDLCPVCGQETKMARGIEVGQVFKLGLKYSESMGAYYKDENMEKQLVVMGCYGIGVTRTLSAIVEQSHDENGIIWPFSVAPYHVIITLVKPADPVQASLAEEVYDRLNEAGVEVLLDDRKERPGVKFKDADLLGIPIRITIGKKAGDRLVEFKLRREENIEEIDIEEALARSVDLVKSEI